MARGAIAKVEVIKKIAAAFGKDYIGEVDKKVYVWAEENGERVQIALSLTCPKVPVEIGTIADTDGDWDFDGSAATAPSVSAKAFRPAEITQEERDTVVELMARLGL